MNGQGWKKLVQPEASQRVAFFREPEKPTERRVCQDMAIDCRPQRWFWVTVQEVGRLGGMSSAIRFR